MVYNVNDGHGWCYSGYCNASCKVDSRPYPCPTTPTPSTTSAPLSSSVPLVTTVATSAPTSGPTSPSTTTLDCNNVDPPRKVICKMYFFPLIVKFLLGLNWSSVGVWVEYNSAPVKLYFS